jgi:hypothetical protein
VEVNAVVESVQTFDAPPDDDDASMLIPEFELGVSGRAGFGKFFHFGGHVSIAFAGASATTYAQSLEPNSGSLFVLSVGPDLGFAAPIGDGSVSWGMFAGVTGTLGWRVGEDETGDVIQVGVLMAFYRVGLALHLFPDEPASCELGIAVQNYAIGDAEHFDLDQHGVVPYVGLRIQSKRALYGYAQIHFPVGFAYTKALPLAGVLGLGWAFGDDPRRSRPRVPGR